MPSFKTSLLDPIDNLFKPVTSSGCLTVTFKDYSNYTTNTDAGHAQANFTNYRTVTITHHTGVSTVLSSLLAITDPLFIYPAATMSSDDLVYTIANGDGIYTVKLVSVPTWSAVIFTTDSCVYYQGVLYKASSVTLITDVPGISVKWVAIGESDLSPKYTDVNYFKILCDTEECERLAVLSAAVVMQDTRCTDNMLCKNEVFLKAVKILILHKAVDFNFELGKYDCAGLNIDEITTLCACS